MRNRFCSRSSWLSGCRDKEEVARLQKCLSDFRSENEKNPKEKQRAKSKANASRLRPVDAWLAPLQLNEHDVVGPKPHHGGTRASDKASCR